MTLTAAQNRDSYPLRRLLLIEWLLLVLPQMAIFSVICLVILLGLPLAFAVGAGYLYSATQALLGWFLLALTGLRFWASTRLAFRLDQLTLSRIYALALLASLIDIGCLALWAFNVGSRMPSELWLWRHTGYSRHLWFILGAGGGPLIVSLTALVASQEARLRQLRLQSPAIRPRPVPAPRTIQAAAPLAPRATLPARTGVPASGEQLKALYQASTGRGWTAAEGARWLRENPAALHGRISTIPVTMHFPASAQFPCRYHTGWTWRVVLMSFGVPAMVGGLYYAHYCLQAVHDLPGGEIGYGCAALFLAIAAYGAVMLSYALLYRVSLFEDAIEVRGPLVIQRLERGDIVERRFQLHRFMPRLYLLSRSNALKSLRIYLIFPMDTAFKAWMDSLPGA